MDHGQDGPALVGLIGDIQYADAEDGSDFMGTEKRYFRNALVSVRAAVECMNAFGVDTVVTMGDAIDGCNSRLGASESALASVLRVLDKSLARQRFDLIGNHELYNFARPALPACGLKCFDGSGASYFSRSLAPGWEAVILDSYDIALIGYPEGEPHYARAIEIIQAQNPSVFTAKGDWFKDLPEEKHRYVPYNGGITEEQLAWLRITLAAAQRDGRSVIVFTHVPAYAPAASMKTIIWNCEDVLAVLREYRDVVVAYIAGHNHNSGYAVDPAGIHHVTLASPLTTEPGIDCFALLALNDGGWAQVMCHGRAVVESGTEGKGRAYGELVLAKGASNELD